jgi:hypothetical protein
MNIRIHVQDKVKNDEAKEIRSRVVFKFMHACIKCL